MSPIFATVHLAPDGLSRLLHLPDNAIRVILALLFLAPDGDYRGSERRLAAAAGLKPIAVRAILAMLANENEPLLSLPALAPRSRRKPGRTPPASLRVQLATATLPFIVHPTEGKRADQPGTGTPSSSASPAGASPGHHLSDGLRQSHPAIAVLIEGWLEHLAQVRGRPLTANQQLVQWSRISELLAEYGAELVAEALRSGISHVTEDQPRPDHYLAAALVGMAGAGRKGTLKHRVGAEQQSSEPTIDF